MQKYDKLPDLIGDIYDAALDPAAWSDVLAKIADFAGGRASVILSKDTSNKFGNAYHCFGIDNRYLKSYSKTYWEFDPVERLVSQDVEQVVSLPDLVPYNEFRRGRFFQEWIRPQGWVDAAKALLDKTVSSYAYISVLRGEDQGMVDAEMRRRMALLVPHLRRALLIGRVIEMKRAEAETYAQTFDGLSSAMFLVDACGQIIHSNLAGGDVLGADDFLCSVDGRLTARDVEADRTLRDLVSAADHGESGIEAGIAGIPLRARNGERHVAYVLPLTSGRHDGDNVAYAAVAALFVHKAVLESSPEVVGKAYQLTPAELRVLQAVVEVGGTHEIATALGLADNTVKTHLRHLFAKTGTKRQAELVKLVAGFSSPLANLEQAPGIVGALRPAAEFERAALKKIA